jgi:methionine aminopeptidase
LRASTQLSVWRGCVPAARSQSCVRTISRSRSPRRRSCSSNAAKSVSATTRSSCYGEYFIRRTGHGIGLTTHEPPYMIEGEERLMEPGMCFSIEPGIYLPDRFGVRIEDIVTVTEDGGRRLNNTDHEMRIVS